MEDFKKNVLEDYKSLQEQSASDSNQGTKSNNTDEQTKRLNKNQSDPDIVIVQAAHESQQRFKKKDTQEIPKQLAPKINVNDQNQLISSTIQLMQSVNEGIDEETKSDKPVTSQRRSVAHQPASTGKKKEKIFETVLEQSKMLLQKAQAANNLNQVKSPRKKQFTTDGLTGEIPNYQYMPQLTN